MEKEAAIKIYDSLSQPPAEALKTITAGNLKGKSDINPQWRYEAMTKTFGLVGIGWKYEVQKLWTEAGAKGEVLAFAQVAVYVRDPETKEWSEPIIGVGGSKLINAFNAGVQSNDEGYKMAVTDAFSTSLKMLGVAADVYAGRWDGSKYSRVIEQEVSPEVREATLEMEEWITSGILEGDNLRKAKYYIDNKDLEGMKRTIEWCRKNNKSA